jgi:hypothetical protein
MNDEPGEGKGVDPSAGADDGAQQAERVTQPADQDTGAAGATGAASAQNTKPAGPAESSNATNVPAAGPPRKTAVRARKDPDTASTAAPAIARDAAGEQQAQDAHQKDQPTAEVTIAGQMILNTIDEYAQKMKPGRLVTQAEGMRQQVSLCNAIFAAINTRDTDFKPLLTDILAVLHRERDAAFRETHLFRYWDSVPLSKSQRRGFEKIITLLKTLADPKTRQTALRQVDFERLLQYGLTEKGRTRFAAYFGK